MNFSKDSFVTPEEILSLVTKLVDDEEYNVLTKGWYISQMQRALQELAFDTFFDDRHVVIPVPKNLVAPMPVGAFNIQQMYLFNGSECNIQAAQNVFWKREYFTAGSGYLASDKYNNSDPFFMNRRADGKERGSSDLSRPGEHRGHGNLYFFNVVEGNIMLSSNCTGYQNIFVKYNGMGCNYGDKPVIPRFLQRAVELYVTEKALSVRIGKSYDAFALSKWSMLQRDAKTEMKGTNGYNGAWADAEWRVKTIDKKFRNDLKEYLTTLES